MADRSNFIVFFMGREGSSAIISMMSAQKGIQVPLFEDLDDRNFLKAHKAGDFPAVVDRIFQTGVYEDIQRHGALYDPGPGAIESIGFKARLFSDPTALASVLVAKRVKVFVLARRNFTEFLASTYVNKMLPSVGNDYDLSAFPQFGLRKMGEEKRQEFLDRIDRLRLEVRMHPFLKEAARLTRNRQRNVRYAAVLAAGGVEIIPIFYEDFLADRVGFVRSMMTRIGYPADQPVRDETAFTKVMVSPARHKLKLSGFLLGQVASLPFRLRYNSALRELRRIGRKSAVRAGMP